MDKQTKIAMIKPANLWALCKTCQDSKWLGDILRHLGGQDVKLDFGQQQVAQMVKQDSEWMDERIEREREAARKRQARARERHKMEIVTRDNTLSREVPVTSLPPSVRPSVPPSLPPLRTRESMSGAEAPDTREEPENELPAYVPTLDEVVKAAMRQHIDPEWAKRWYADLQGRDFAYISHGSTVRVNRRNLVTCMRSWHNQELRGGGTDAGKPIGTIHHEEGYDAGKLGI